MEGLPEGLSHRREESSEYIPSSHPCGTDTGSQLVVALPLTMAMGHFRPLATTAPLPTRWETIGTFVFCLAFEEVGFFYVHRMFHSPRFYKSVHKLHHSPFTLSILLDMILTVNL
jgi:sterol desaturase/sphingolipid hydroxylase (fatty acid hydroxylase superfamily)